MTSAFALDACIDTVLTGSRPQLVHEQHSYLSAELEILCVWGYFAPALAQRLAFACELDQKANGWPIHPRLASLAKLGKSGQYVGNVRRDFMTFLTSSLGVLFEPLLIRVPYMRQNTGMPGVTGWMSLPVLMPNEFIEYLWGNHRAYFNDLLGGGLEKFWNSVRPDDPKLVNHPMKAMPGWKTKMIPLALHGDGVRFSKSGNSLLVLSFAFLLAKHWSWECIFLITMFTKYNRCYEAIDGHDTWDIIYRYVCHGFAALLKGIHPEVDPYGNAWTTTRQRDLAGKLICGGEHGACIWHMPMDADHAANELGCQGASHNEICTWCPANKSNFSFKNFRPDANYKLCCYEPGPSDRPVSRHRIWNSGLGLTRFFYTGDVMHGSELGPLLHLHGSTICDMMGNGFGPSIVGNGAAEQRLDRVWQKVVHEYTMLGTTKRVSQVTKGMMGGFKSSRPAQISLKAAESRHLVKPILSLLRKDMNRTTLDKHRIRAYECVDDMYEVIMTSGFVLSDAEADAIESAVDQFLLHYNVLAKAAEEKGLFLYHVTPKFHWLWHIARFAKFLNPRLIWCYAFEDFVGRIQRCASSCQAGTPLWKVPVKCTDNYIRVLSYVLSGYSTTGARRVP